MGWTRGQAFLLALLVLAAGCLGADQGPTGGEASDERQASPTGQTGTSGTTGTTNNSSASGPEAPEAGATVASVVQMTGCDQYHVFYVTQWSSWAGLVPEGFGPDGTDPTGETTTAYQHISACTVAPVAPDQAATEVVEAWYGVAVTPPAALADPEAVLHLVPVDITVDGSALHAVYEAWGFGQVLRAGTITWTDQPVPAGRLGSVTIETATGSYSLDAALGPPQEGTAAGSDRVYAVQDGQVTGWFDHAWPGWTDLGSGALTFQAEGDAEAPPAYPGSVHQVTETDVTTTFGQPGP